MRAERLRRTKDIDLVRAQGEQRSDRHLSVRAKANGLGAVRLAVVASRAVGNAVKRNRARRRVREAIRIGLRERAAAAGVDLVVVARRAALEAPASAIREAVERQIGPALERTER
jgi:ribonuclease P protein component